MNTTPLVSVIIPTYNRSRIVGSAIDSALGQSYGNLEIIVIDDGSTDGTEVALKSYEGRIRYLKKENGGVSSARNAGIRASTGEYIAFLDSDDYWRKDKIRRQVECATNNPEAGLIYSDILCVNDAGLRMTRRQMVHEFHRGNVFRQLFKRTFVPTCSVVAKRACFDRVGLFDESMKCGEDGDMWLRIAAEYTFEYLDSVLAVHKLDSHVSLSGDGIKMLCAAIAYRERAMARRDDLISEFKDEAMATMSQLYACAAEMMLDKDEAGKAASYVVRSIKSRPASINTYKRNLRSITSILRMGGVYSMLRTIRSLNSDVKRSILLKSVRHVRPQARVKKRYDTSLTIICLHRVCSVSGVFYDKNIGADPEGLRRLIEYLKHRYRIINQKQLVDRLDGNRVPELPELLITFDDGYIDNAVNALPILRQAGAPATVYVTAAYIDTHVIPWGDRVSYLLHCLSTQRRTLKTSDDMECVSEKDVDASVEAICGKLKYYTSERRDEIIEEMYRLNEVDKRVMEKAAISSGKGYMTSDAMRSWRDAGMEFGAHTMTHQAVTTLDGDRMRAEISDSITRIESIVEMPVITFAYPYGRKGDYNSESRKILEEIGIKSSMTLEYGVNGPDVDRYELMRIGVNHRTDYTALI